MSTSSSTPLMAIETRVEFASSSIQTMAPQQRNLKAIEVDYEVRSQTGAIQGTLAENPFVKLPARPWRVAVNGAALFFVVVVSGLLLVSLAPMLWGWQPVVAPSGDMEPSIRSSDIVVTSPSDGQGLGEGTIVVRYDVEDQPLLGRIVVTAPGGYMLVNDADLPEDLATPITEAEFVPAGQIDGIGVYVVPWVGLPFTWLKTEAWMRLALLLVGALAALALSRYRWVNPKTKWVAEART